MKCCNCKENKTLSIVLKVLLALGIVAAVAAIAKVIYDRYKKKLKALCEDDCDCNFECLDEDASVCDCDNCEYANGGCSEAADEEASEAEVPAETAEEAEEAPADAEA